MFFIEVVVNVVRVQFENSWGDYYLVCTLLHVAPCLRAAGYLKTKLLLIKYVFVGVQ